MPDGDVTELLQEMRKIPSDGRYFSLTLTASEDGHSCWDVFSEWVGFTEDKPQREIRQASPVNPAGWAAHWTEIGLPWFVVNDLRQLLIFLRLGGAGLVRCEVAEKYLSNVIAPCACGQSKPLGFTGINGLSNNLLNRAPTPKQRMGIIKRDDYRCRVCGRRSADHVDVELHVHHIHPWASGGLTADENLITLCHTCHKGLDPHEEHGLYELIGVEVLDRSAAQVAGVRAYRELIKRATLGGQTNQS